MSARAVSCSDVREVHAVDFPAAEKRRKPPRWLVIVAFAAVYLVWGSTYLGIHVAVATIPPFLMAGARFVLAGSVLYGALRAFGAARPELVHWRSATIAGALLLVVGNGGISWVQQYAPTNLTAIMVAATPLWMILIDWVRPDGKRPTALTLGGLLLGFAGVTLVVCSRGAGGKRELQAMAVAVLLIAPLCWAIGSIYSRHAPQSRDLLLNIAMQMLVGGVLMLGISLLKGEMNGFTLAQVSHASAWAFLYLSLAGSLVGFTAYAWLLQVSTPAKVSTYAYVNPLIAVILGSLVLRETLPAGMLVAGGLILAGVVAITARGSR